MLSIISMPALSRCLYVNSDTANIAYRFGIWKKRAGKICHYFFGCLFGIGANSPGVTHEPPVQDLAPDNGRVSRPCGPWGGVLAIATRGGFGWWGSLGHARYSPEVS